MNIKKPEQNNELKSPTFFQKTFYPLDIKHSGLTIQL